MEAIMAKIQELKMQAWKGGYLAGLGEQERAWKMRPKLDALIKEIENLASQSVKGVGVKCQCSWDYVTGEFPQYFCGRCGAPMRL